MQAQQKNLRVALLRRQTVEAITGLSRSSIYSQMAAGTFPRNVAVGHKSVRWVEAEVLAWCQSKIERRQDSSASI